MSLGSGKTLVTGAAGFIGAELVRQLRADGGEPLEVVNQISGGLGSVRADLREAGALNAHLAEGDVIYHLAGRADVSASLRDAKGDFDLNLTTTLNVLESARRTRATLIIASTASVYDPASTSPLAEDARVRPVSPYGAAKAAAEIYAAAYHAAYGLDVRIVRLFSIYGPGKRSMAIADFYRRLRANPARLEIRGDGGQTRDYLYVSDAARALRLVAARGAPGGIYNAGSGKGRRIADVARAVAGAAGCPDCEIAPDARPQCGELYEMVADIGRLTRLGFIPETSFETGLATTIRWFDKIWE
jgi:nucleoside-diphosphate-sugar epimerase